MALKQKDKDWIKKTIREEFKAALFREITISRMAKGPGDVEGKIETATMNLLDILAESLPQWEQSLRGSEEASNQARNRSIETLGKINAVGETLVSMEESVITMARFALVLKETGLLEQLEKVIEIEYKDPKAIDHEANPR